MENKIAIFFVTILGVILFCVVGTLVFFSIKFPLKFKKEIEIYSAMFNLNPEIVSSVINAESGFDENKVSSAGAVGLMQIMPKTAVYIADMLDYKNFETKMLFEPETNILFGCCYMNYLNTKFKDDVAMLSAYNAGEGTVLSWLNTKSFSLDGKTLIKIPYEETNNYIKNVEDGIKYYKNKFKSKKIFHKYANFGL